MAYFKKLLKNVKHLSEISVKLLLFSIASLFSFVFVVLLLILSPILVLFKDEIITYKLRFNKDEGDCNENN